MRAVRACVRAYVCSRAVDALEPSTRYVRVGEKGKATGRRVYESLATGVFPPPIIRDSPRGVMAAINSWELGDEKSVFFSERAQRRLWVNSYSSVLGVESLLSSYILYE